MKKFYLNFLLIFFLSSGICQANCVDTSNKVFNRAVRWGYEAKLVVGDFEGKRHQWVEYYYKDKWRIWDEAIWYIGKSWYTAEELDYKEDYILEVNLKGVK